jgi:hypothetical protein
MAPRSEQLPEVISTTEIENRIARLEQIKNQPNENDQQYTSRHDDLLKEYIRQHQERLSMTEEDRQAIDDEVVLKEREKQSRQAEEEQIHATTRHLRQRRAQVLLPSRIEPIRQEMIEIYKKYNPRKIDDVEQLLKENIGKEDQLLLKIRTKYETREDLKNELVSAMNEVSEENAREMAFYRLGQGVSGGQVDLERREEHPNKLLTSYIKLYFKPTSRKKWSNRFLKVITALVKIAIEFGTEFMTRTFFPKTVQSAIASLGITKEDVARALESSAQEMGGYNAGRITEYLLEKLQRNMNSNFNQDDTKRLLRDIVRRQDSAVKSAVKDKQYLTQRQDRDTASTPGSPPSTPPLPPRLGDVSALMDEQGVGLTVNTPFNVMDTYWDELTVEQQGIAGELGFNESTWNLGELPGDLYKPWSQLPETSRNHLITFGLNETSWNDLVKIPGSETIAVNYNNPAAIKLDSSSTTRLSERYEGSVGGYLSRRKYMKRKSTKRKYMKRKSTKRKSTKRKSKKRKSTKRKSTKRKIRHKTRRH